MGRKKKNTKKQAEEIPQEEPTTVDQTTLNEQEITDSAETTAPETDSKTQELAELKDKYIRMMAEFDNYKKRTVRERIDLMNTAAKDTMSAILPVLDDFDRAKKNADDDGSTEVFTEGVNLVYNKLYSVLQQRGLKPMESTGETFDPEFHEALTEIPAPTEEMKGKVIDTIEKGYLLKDKIIRYAKVVVGK